LVNSQEDIANAPRPSGFSGRFGAPDLARDLNSWAGPEPRGIDSAYFGGELATYIGLGLYSPDSAAEDVGPATQGFFSRLFAPKIIAHGGQDAFDGIARVHLHPPASPDEVGHASIEVSQYGGDTMHTHQLGATGTKAYSALWTGGPGTGGIYEFPLTNSGGALAQQEVF
jgi:hypothetical protein